jgi:DNA-binding NarL/FixJ family response regulator
MNDPTVLIISPEPLLRLGLRRFLKEELDIRRFAEAATSSESLDAQAAHRPLLVVLVSHGKCESAPRLVRDLRRNRADQRILVAGSALDPDHVRRVLQAGALGFVTSLDDLAELKLAIVAVMGGDLHVSRSAAGVVMKDMRGSSSRPEPNEPSLSVLSDRELEVFRLVGSGQGCKEIAAGLNISVKTVETHQRRMKEKLSLPNGAELRRLSSAHHARSQMKPAAS